MIKWLSLLTLIMGCSQINTINLKKHTFNQDPKILIWFQIEGLAPEQLAMLRFAKYSAGYRTAFESSSCFGGMWNYNLFKLRPNGHEGFLSQMTGKSNIKNSCEDFKHKPLWNYLSHFKSGVFEIGTSGRTSLERAWKCSEGEAFKEHLTLWKMSPNKKRSKFTFNVLGNDPFEKGNVYYDQSCNRKRCRGDLVDSVKGVFSSFAAKESFTLFIIRDHSYARALKRKDIKKARSILSKFEELYSYFHTRFDVKRDLLILVTSSAVRNIELPNAGRDWKSFEQKGRKVLFRRNSLMSYALASGAKAENFCGIYEESEILKRVLIQQKKRMLGI
ncbi:MAG: hypothetical protein DRQ88_12110 [Epsilonproteobacteria bacterium]|nr:MAG: hypothetical protein DRQ88_12110 [Campylobacterota bacterium]RLA64701.1 MAG: hypothetical protein DRQ89_03300 [Campylobacterota bacterium]